MKEAKDEEISRDYNGRTHTTPEDAEGATSNESPPVRRNPLTRTRTGSSSDSTANEIESSIQNRSQAISGNSAETSSPQAKNREFIAQTKSKQNITSNNEMNHRINDEQQERSLSPHNQNYPSIQQELFRHASEEWRDEDRAEVASTASSFLQAAAIPPRLVAQETTPGAVCVPGLIGSFDDQHDNLLDMEDENDENNTRNYSNSMISRSHGSTVQSPLSTFSACTPIVAELAPSYPYNEREVEDRLAERLEAQISQRLQQEVDRRFSMDKRQHAIAEVVSASDGIDSINVKRGDKKEEENFKICGIRRTWWGMIICVIMLLTIAGVGGTYLWFSRAREIMINSTSNNNPINDSSSPSKQSIAPTISPTTANIPESPQATANVTAMPTTTPTPEESYVPTNVSPTRLSPADLRREYLIESMASYIIPDEFVDLPVAYFTSSAYSFQRAALDWMASVDLQTDILNMPIQLLVERYVLALLYYSTGGPQMWNESLFFLTSSNVCNWNNGHSIQNENISNNVTIEENPNASDETKEYALAKKGVFCENGSLYVTSIQIPENSLEGKIPWELSLLEHLSQINFDTNNFYGSIPTELSRLSELHSFWFKSNALTGRLPIEFSNATKLASIDIGDNSISSVLPSEWGFLSNLFYISIQMNGVTGTLPPTWRKLNQLKTLDLEGNKLRGTIPPEYGELTKLVALFLESNRLEGILPTTFGSLTNLANFFVEDNLFSGTVPTEYSSLINLEFFWFHNNSLTGSVDETFCNPTSSPNSANLKSNCLGDGLAQIQCSCCTYCCDSNGTNCEVNL